MAMDISNNYPNNLYSDLQAEHSPMPVHLYLLFLILLLPISLVCYISYNSVIESMMDDLRLIVIVSPFLLLLAIHWLYDSNLNARRWWIPFLVPLPERETFHRAGGSPWGVALLLVIVLFLISNQSYFRDIWFPILNR